MRDVLSQEFRHAARRLCHGGSTTLITVVTLSLGIGVASALFSIVDAVLLRPLVPDQDRVVRVTKVDVQRGNFPVPLSLHEFGLWRDASRSFEAVAAIDHAAAGPASIRIDGTSAIARLAPVSSGFFTVVHRGAPLSGRWLSEADEQAGTDIAAVISERFWRRASGGDPGFVGRRIEWAGDRSLVIVGIAPATLDYPLGTDIWAAAARVFDGQAGRFDARSRTFAQFEMFGRLAPGVSVDRVLFAALAITLAAISVFGVLSNDVRQRRRELAVRCAVGASPIEIRRSVIVRSLLIAVSGALIGGAIAASATRAMRSLLFDVQPLDPIAFAAGVGTLVAVVLIAAYLPARLAARTDPASVLRSE